MYKSATKCNETIGKWCKNKHGASKIIDTFETYQKLYKGRVGEITVYQFIASGAAAIVAIFAHL
jgi:hypothetical protein